MPAPLSPHIEWLQRRWALPREKSALVGKLLEVSAAGSTALRLKPEDLAGDWGNALSMAGWPGQAPQAPILAVLNDDSAYLQSRRSFEAEAAVAQDLIARVQPRGDTIDSGVESALKQLFPNAEPGDLQVKAARTALGGALTLITGGPGTGKTYTLARILALLLVQAHDDPRPLRIRLAAPTGKAADRMKEAVRDSIKSLPPDFDHTIDALNLAADSSSTLHKLLEYHPGKMECGYGADRPLPCDVLIVDEASMIDLLLWKALLEAMPKQARSRLIILGDPFQLESVGAGDVLYQLVNAPVLSRSQVRLEFTRRFKGKEGIEALAKALISNDAPAAEALLEASRGTEAVKGLCYLGAGNSRSLWEKLPPALLQKLQAIAQADTPEEALRLQNSVRILCAHREGGMGALGVSAFLQARLEGGPGSGPGARSQPIIINVNDPETGLRNGSVGIIHTSASGERKAWFPAPRKDGALQEEPIARLPDYSPAWALTIHRSQGSEFEDVLVVLPKDESPLATRELIYTAITRARCSVSLLGPLETISKAIASPGRRCTLLGWHLGSPKYKRR